MSKAGYVNKSVSATWVHDEASPGLKRVTLKATGTTAFDVQAYPKETIARAIAFPLKDGLIVAGAQKALTGESDENGTGARDVTLIVQSRASDSLAHPNNSSDAAVDEYALYLEYF